MIQIDQCIHCSREISNPICAQCNYRHLSLWLNDKSLKLDMRTDLVKKIKKSLFIENANNTDCVICYANGVCICTYCFFRKVRSMVEQINPPSEMIEDFLLSFNYELYSDYPPIEYEIDQ